MHDYFLLGGLFIFLTGFVVWFGCWMHKNKSEALDLQSHDEHESCSIG